MRLYSLILAFTFSAILLKGQSNIVIDTSKYALESLIQDVLINSPCADVSNLKFTGKPGQIGYFNHGQTALNMKDGIILSTGNIFDASGPNSHTGTTTSFFDVWHEGDPDLARIANENIFSVYDDAILEFDFVPLLDHVEFEFIFASEEYCDFAGPHSLKNDVFGFFLSGPDINGPFENNAVNLAKGVDGSTNISVLNINHNLNYTYYIDNTPLQQNQILAEHYDACRLNTPRDGINSLLEKDGDAIDFLEYDGYTITLKAQHDLVPHQKYHLKIALADVGDASWDSAVFLKAGSFKTGQPISNISEPDKISCNNPEVMLDGSSSTTGSSFTFSWFTYDGNIISGHDQIQAIVDKPGTYYLAVNLAGMECGDTSSIEVLFDGPNTEISFATSDTITCTDDLVMVEIQMQETGLYEYSIEYPDGANSLILNESNFETNQAGWHIITATAENGCSDTKFHFVAIDSSTAHVEFNDIIFDCQLDTVQIVPVWVHKPALYEIFWSTDDGIILDVDNGNALIGMAGTYTATILNLENGCLSKFDAIVASDLEFPSFDMESELYLTCDDLTVSPFIVGHNLTGNEGIIWTNSIGEALNSFSGNLSPDFQSPGTFVIHVRGANGCISRDTLHVITLEEVPTIEVVQVDKLKCDGRPTLIEITTSPDVTQIQWSTDDGFIDNISTDEKKITISQPGIYEVVVTNENDCSGMTTIEVKESKYPEVNIEPVNPSLNCEFRSNLYARSDIEDYQFEWYYLPTAELLGNEKEIEVFEIGEYVLKAVNEETGCESRDTAHVSDYIDVTDFDVEYFNCRFDQAIFSLRDAAIESVIEILYDGEVYGPGESVFVKNERNIELVRADGCRQILSIGYENHEVLRIDANYPLEVHANQPFSIDLITNRSEDELESVHWNLPEINCTTCLSIELSLADSTDFTVVVEDIYGCEEEIFLSFNPIQEKRIFIPTAFSPNDDGLNDILAIYHDHRIEAILSFQIFDRWGSLIFDRKNTDFENSPMSDETFFWSGEVNGEEAPSGVYIYTATALGSDGRQITESGSISLIR